MDRDTLIRLLHLVNDAVRDPVSLHETRYYIAVGVAVLSSRAERGAGQHRVTAFQDHFAQRVTPWTCVAGRYQRGMEIIFLRVVDHI